MTSVLMKTGSDPRDMHAQKDNHVEGSKRRQRPQKKPVRAALWSWISAPRAVSKETSVVETIQPVVFVMVDRVNAATMAIITVVELTSEMQTGRSPAQGPQQDSSPRLEGSKVLALCSNIRLPQRERWHFWMQIPGFAGCTAGVYLW